VIKTARQASDIIAAVAKANADEVRSAVLKVLAQLDSPEIGPKALLEIAEVVRPSVDFVVFDYRTGYADRALPFGEQESRRFGNAMSLLDHTVSLYRRVYDEATEAGPANPAASLRPLALQRCMASMVSQMIEHYRGRQTVEAGLWKRLQRHLQTGAGEKLNTTRVPDPLDPRGTVTPLGAYGRALLLSIAQAGAMAQRNLEATVALTSMFADLVDVTIMDQDPGKAPPMAQGVTGGVGIQRTGRIRVVGAGGATHLVNTTKVDAALGALIQNLAAGQTPERVGLGHVANADLNNLLPRLRRIWCGTGEIRETQRTPLRETATVTVGFSGISARFDPETLHPPPEFEIWDYRKGSQSDGKTDVVLEKDREVPPERWKVRDHSNAGMRAKRHSQGARLRRHQLLAVEFEGMAKGTGFTLGEFRWLQQHIDAEGGISAGVRFLTTHASVALIRIHGLQQGQYQSVGPAFVVIEPPHVNLVLPYGWYAAKRDADLWHNKQIVPVKLVELKSRGADFEVVRIEPREAAPK